MLPRALQPHYMESNPTTMAVQGLTSKTVPTVNATPPLPTVTSRSLPTGLASQSRSSTRCLGSPPPDSELASSQPRLSRSMESRSDPRASFTSTNSKMIQAISHMWETSPATTAETKAESRQVQRTSWIALAELSTARVARHSGPRSKITVASVLRLISSRCELCEHWHIKRQ